MKVLNISYSDLFGGAAKSAYKIHKAINLIDGKFKSKMFVIKKISKDPSVMTFNNNYIKLLFKLKNYIGIVINKIDNNINPTSYNIFNSPLLKIINNSKFDIINLHWINAETLSLSDIRRIKKPYMITLHDMWWICGTEHYLNHNDKNWIRGKFNNKFSNLNFLKKKTLKPKAIICPSKWLSNIVARSLLYKTSRVFHIPYPVNQKIFYPKMINSIKDLKLKRNEKIKIFFGVFGDANDARKGIDLLIESLNLINENLFELIIASKNSFVKKTKFKIINLNYIKTEKKLSAVYNLCDIVVLTSRLDNLPNIAIEAQSCGKPLIGYNVGGISDIIKDNHNGYLIEPFKIRYFAKKLEYLIKNKKKREEFSKNALTFAKNKWAYRKIKKDYKKLLLELF